MRILITPFSPKKFLDIRFRVSGVDECLIKQIECLSADHEVRGFLFYSNFVGPEYFVFSDGRPNYEKDKEVLLKFLREKIREFKPDVILSNTHYYSKIYQEFAGIPLIYLSHCLAGTFADVQYAKYIEKMLQNGATLAGNSNFHKSGVDKFHEKKLRGIRYDVKMTEVVPSTYAKVLEVKEHDGQTILTVGACNKSMKNTFIMHSMVPDNVTSKIFTTVKFVGGDIHQEYLRKSLELYKNKKNTITSVDAPHSEIMEEIKTAVGVYVGRSDKETFCITAIEALQNGVPILIHGNKKVHPAEDFVEPCHKDCISYFTNQSEFMDIFSRYKSFDLDKRKSLAESCVKMMGKENFRAKYETMLNSAINRHKEKQKLTFGEFLV